MHKRNNKSGLWQMLICFVLMAFMCTGCAFFSVNSESEGAGEESSRQEKDTEPSIATENQNSSDESFYWPKMKKTGSMELAYANQFTVDYYYGYSLITIGENRYLIVPKGYSVPDELDKDITVIRLPLEHVYLVASAAMDLFRELDVLSMIEMTGTAAADWTIPEIRERVESGQIEYCGKYSAPDYERILTKGCELAIESTMIYHKPEVKDQLEELGIPVLIDRSSYESHPLGRVEWIKLYGLLSGKLSEAEEFMKNCDERMNKVLSETSDSEKEKKTVAFFYISSNKYVNIRKPGDYITKLIGMAGGEYIFANVIPDTENDLSTMNMEREIFFKTAVDADIIIYNSTVDVELDSLDKLLEKDELLADCKAVKTGNVWCSKHSAYQETTGIVDMLEELYAIINEETDDSTDMDYFIYFGE